MDKWILYQVRPKGIRVDHISTWYSKRKGIKGKIFIKVQGPTHKEDVIINVHETTVTFTEVAPGELQEKEMKRRCQEPLTLNL